MPTNLVGTPPIRESIVDSSGSPMRGFAKWLSNLSIHIMAADNSVNTTTADASDLATAITLVNQLKADVNDLKNKLRAAEHMI